MSTQVISLESQSRLLEYAQKIIGWHKTCGQFRNKMDVIDIAYARYQEALRKQDNDGIDRYGSVACNVTNKEIVNPVVLASVETTVAYLSEVFLSGYPRFPVVSTPAKKELAEALEGIMQDHITLSQSDAEMQLLFKDLAKYNLGVLETDWAPIATYNPQVSDPTSINPSDPRKQKYDVKHINYLRRWNLRNTFMDPLVDPVKVASDGEFIGHTEIFNRTKLKRHLNYLTNEGLLIHPKQVERALKSGPSSDVWQPDPTISAFMVNSKETTDYDSWMGFAPPIPDGMLKVPANGQGIYYVTRIYVRIIPTDFLLNVPDKNSPQIWKLEIVNNQILIQAEKLNTSMDMFPVYAGHAHEDGFGLQTQSVAELSMSIQEATTRMFNIRFQAARRAIQDRGLYNPDMIRSSDINSPIPSAKIAVKVQALGENGGLEQAYRPIPFDPRGTDGVLQDAIIINDWNKDLTGQNNASRGQFQKGNKTMAEFETVMGNSENRARLIALLIAIRIINPTKEQLKLNLLQFGEDTKIISPRTKKPVELSIDELITENMQFEVADGYTPKSKLANTDMLMGLMNLIGTSPYLQQVYGQQMPGMVAHMAQLGGVRGFDEYADAAIAQYSNQMEFQQKLMQMMQQIQQQTMGAAAQPGTGQPQ